MPDCLLTSHDTIELSKNPRSCTVIGHVKRGEIEDALLVSVDPPLPSATYGWNGFDLEYVILAIRLEGTSLLEPTEWPVHVYVGAPRERDAREITDMMRDNVEILTGAPCTPTDTTCTDCAINPLGDLPTAGRVELDEDIASLESADVAAPHTQSPRTPLPTTTAPACTAAPRGDAAKATSLRIFPREICLVTAFVHAAQELRGEAGLDAAVAGGGG